MLWGQVVSGGCSLDEDSIPNVVETLPLIESWSNIV